MIDILAMEEFVKTNLSYSQLLESNDFSQEELVLEQQCNNLKRHIVDSLVRYPQAGNLDIFVTALSASISRICSGLYELYLKVISCRKIRQRREILRFYKKACDHIAQILQLIRTLVPEKFDENLPVPFSIYLAVRINLRSKCRSLDRILPFLDTQNAPLIPLIKKIIQDHIRTHTCLSYKMVTYLENLLNKVNTLDEKPARDYNLLLHVRLIAFNFNHPQYIEHCNDKLEEKYGELPAEKKLFVYRWYEMNLKRILPQKGAAFYDHLPSAQEALKVYVSEEIIYLQGDVFGRPSEELERISTDLTVGEFGLLFITFIRTKIITEGNIMKVMRLAARYFSTKGAEQPSPDSVRAKGYSATPETSVSLIDKLFKVIAEIRGR